METITIIAYVNSGLYLAEYDGSGILQRTFVWGNYIDEALRMRVGESDFYYLHDHLYSPAVLLTSSGTVVERYEYDAYGTTHFMDPSFGSRTATQYGVTTLFTGRTLDALDSGALKIMYYRARSFDPTIGRFLQQDPIGYADGMNLYEYVKSRPLMYVDPSGLIYGNLTDEEIKRIIAEAQSLAFWFKLAGTPLARKLFEYWESGKGATKEGETLILSDAEVERIANAGQLGTSPQLIRTIMKMNYRNMGLLGCAPITISMPQIEWEIPQPNSIFDRTVLADMFFSFGTLHYSYNVSGTVCRLTCCNYMADVTVKVNIWDYYEFKNRDWYPIPGITSITDAKFWVWQQYGIPAPFHVKGSYSKDIYLLVNACQPDQSPEKEPKIGY